MARRLRARDAGIMQVRLLLLAGVAGACGWLARGLGALPEATAAPERPPIVITAPPVYQVVVAAADCAPPDPEAVAETEAEPEPEPGLGEGEDLGAVIARVQLAAADHNGIAGVITDKDNGEPLPGVTVVVTGPQLASSLTAITDEQGRYKIADIPAGFVLVTLYYADITVERPDVVISSFALTPLSEVIDQRARSPREGPIITVSEVVNVVQPVRTFESVIDTPIE